MNTKKLSLVVLSLSVCTLVMAGEYKTPNVGFKQTAPSHKQAEVTELNEGYKVEGATKTDRQIASEKERDPSSVDTKDQPAEEDMKADEKQEVKPWLYRNKLDSAY